MVRVCEHSLEEPGESANCYRSTRDVLDFCDTRTWYLIKCIYVYHRHIYPKIYQINVFHG